MNYVFSMLSIFQCFYLHANVGNKCTLSLDEGPGKYARFSQCPSAIDELQAGNYSQTCGSIGIEPVVCCRTFSALMNNVSEQKHKYHSDPTHWIVGGIPASAREFPHMASLGYATGDVIVWGCGGSLISDQFVLTAAHCLQSRNYGDAVWIRLGEQNLPPQSTYPDDYQIIERIAHPQYRPPSAYNDIALIKLDRSVKFTTFVKPAFLYTIPNISPDTTLIATGWGQTKFEGQPSEQLMKVDLVLFSEQECNETYSDMAGTRKLEYGILDDSQFCAGGRNQEKDTCRGDSGGPLQITSHVDNRNIFRIVGVTSFGKTCGVPNSPGIYSRVSYYVPWIVSVVWPSAGMANPDDLVGQFENAS